MYVYDNQSYKTLQICRQYILIKSIHLVLHTFVWVNGCEVYLLMIMISLIAKND